MVVVVVVVVVEIKGDDKKRGIQPKKDKGRGIKSKGKGEIGQVMHNTVAHHSLTDAQQSLSSDQQAPAKSSQFIYGT